MENKRKSSSFNDDEFPMNNYFSEANVFKERNKTNLFQKSNSSQKRHENATFSGLNRDLRNDVIEQFNLDDRSGGFPQMILPVGETSRRFSSEASSHEKANVLKKGNIIKEQGSCQLIDDVWFQQKKYRPRPEENLRDRKCLSAEQDEVYENTEYEPHQVSARLTNDRFKQVENMGISQAFLSSDETRHYNATCASSDITAMHKTYVPYRYVADASYSGADISSSDNLAATAMTHSQQSAKWNARNSEQRQDRKLYAESEYESQSTSIKSNDSKVTNNNSGTDMNISSNSSIVATDLSQHNASNNPIHRGAPASKSFQQIVLTSHLSEQRTANQPQESGEVYNLQSETKQDKRFDVNNFKHNVWGGFEAPLFIEHQHQARQQSYDTTYCTDCHTMPHVPPVAYDVNPLLLKEHAMGVKQERGIAPPNNISMTWDKGGAPFDKMIGNMYRPVHERDQYYLKPPPVDLDDLSDDERERMRVKRERNRVAAAKCRNRRRELLERLEKEAEQLEREQEVLRDNVKRLQAQKRKLGNMLDKHEPGCSNKIDEATSFASERKQTEHDVAE